MLLCSFHPSSLAVHTFMFKAVRIHLIGRIMCTYNMDKLLVLVVILCIRIFCVGVERFLTLFIRQGTFTE